MTLPVAEYLDDALDFIEQTALGPARRRRRPRRRRTPAIRWALERPGDRHSFLMEPARAALGERGQVAGYGLMIAADVVARVFAGSPGRHAGFARATASSRWTTGFPGRCSPGCAVRSRPAPPSA